MDGFLKKRGNGLGRTKILKQSTFPGVFGVSLGMGNGYGWLVTGLLCLQIVLWSMDCRNAR